MNNNWKTNDWWVSPYNYAPEVTAKMDLNHRIEIHDATLRDGEQTPGVVLRKEEKVEIATKLSEAGVHRIEAGMPAVSDEDRQAIETIKKKGLKSQIFAFARAMEKDLELCRECGVDGVIIELPIGKPKLELQFKWDVQRVIDMSLTAIAKAKALGLYTVLFPYDTTRADEADLEALLTAVSGDIKPDSIGLVDTMGCAMPGTAAFMTRLIKQKTGLPVEIHTHNDFGLALGATLEAVAAGAEVAHCCLNGMGERTGNCSLEELIMALELMMGVKTGVDLQKLISLSKELEHMTGFYMPTNKPVVGSANFTRESGIGADALLTAPLAMFALHPNYLCSEAKLVLGKKSGLTSIEMKLKAYNITLDDDAKAALLKDVKMTGTQNKRLLSEEEFLALVARYKKI